MAYNSAYFGSQVDAAVGAVRSKENTWDGKQDKLTGVQGQIVGFDSNGEAVPQAAPNVGVTSFNGRSGAVSPQSGDYTAAQVGAVPTNRTINGQALNANITLDAADVGAVPTTRTVNGHALSANVTLDAEDVGARPDTWTPTAAQVGAVPTSRTVNGKALSSNITLSASDVGAVPTSRTVNGKALSSNITLTASDVGAGPGKRTARFTVGTSTAGWTAADCDYLCDGSADQTEINNAINALPSTGGEIVILDGTYNITGPINMSKANVKLSGNGAATVLKRMWRNSSATQGIVIVTGDSCCITSITFDGNSGSYHGINNKAIYINSDNNIIANNIVKNDYAGIYANTGTVNETISGNICINNENTGILSQADNSTINGNVCNSTTLGIEVEGNQNAVNGNVCSNNSASGIAANGDNNSVSGNACISDWHGIAVGGENNSVCGNVCKDNSRNGVSVTGNQNVITGNICMRGTGITSDYASNQYTIQCTGSYNLIIGNNIRGKNYSDSGSGNTWADNKYS